MNVSHVSIYRTHLYGRCYTYFTQSCNVIMCDPYLAYFVPHRDLRVLYCIHKNDLIIIKKVFTELCCV